MERQEVKLIVCGQPPTHASFAQGGGCGCQGTDGRLPWNKWDQAALSTTCDSDESQLTACSHCRQRYL